MTARQERQWAALLKEFSSRQIELRCVPLHLSRGGLACHKGKWFCLISDFSSLREMIETAAHELAHWDLHQQDPRETGDPSLELEAEEGGKAILSMMERSYGDILADSLRW